MELQALKQSLTVCKVASPADVDLTREFFFLSRTDREVSLVCETKDAPKRTTAREDGWRGFRIAGTLEFSLVGVLSRITGILAEHGIAVFAVSTFETDYVLVKADVFPRALEVLTAEGYSVRP